MAVSDGRNLFVNMQPSPGGDRIKRCTPSVCPSVRLSQFTRNRKAIETSNVVET